MEKFNSKVVLNALFQGKKAIVTTSFGTVQIQNVGKWFYLKAGETVTKVDSTGCLKFLDSAKDLENAMKDDNIFTVEIELK